MHHREKGEFLQTSLSDSVCRWLNTIAKSTPRLFFDGEYIVIHFQEFSRPVVTFIEHEKNRTKRREFWKVVSTLGYFFQMHVFAFNEPFLVFVCFQITLGWFRYFVFVFFLYTDYPYCIRLCSNLWMIYYSTFIYCLSTVMYLFILRLIYR